MNILVVLLPLISSIIAGFLKDKPAQIISIAGVFTSAVLSGIIFYNVAILGNTQNQLIYEWIKSGDFIAEFRLKIDVLTAVMLIVVTWISTAVYIYAVGYMHHDKKQAKFMSYLGFFTFCMLVLVTSSNFVQLFLGWEGVGLASYLLIGFWTNKATANTASIKAFIMNRVADCGFLLAIFLIYQVYGSVDFETVFNAEIQQDTINIICFLLFFGCMGKSAQLGLHSWLPDAMEGPTPVSALLHAATMVTAGVFLIARCSPLFEHASYVREIIIVIASLTCVFGGLHAMVKNDIKKVIAYSTVSQLGYMFLACGVGAYSAGIFHLFTHAFFKALLFLSAGSVIHAVGTQDMRKMGGLRDKIPYTYVAMLIGTLAIVGIPPLSAYFSKDLILESAYASSAMMGKFGYIMGTLTVFISSFYSFRLMFMVFGKTVVRNQDLDIHESPKIMLIPMGILAVLAIFAGGVGYYIFHMGAIEFWNGSIFILETNTVLEDAHHVPFIVKYAPLLLTILGFFVAKKYCFSFCHSREGGNPVFKGKDIYMIGSRFFTNLGKITLSKGEGFFNKLYDWFIILVVNSFGKHLWKIWDNIIIDGSISKGLSNISLKTANKVSQIQNGYIVNYAFFMIMGVVVLLGWGLILAI